MFTLKLVYNDSVDIHPFTNALSGIMETYNEDVYNEKKNAWSIKNACGAREVPFVAVYVNGKIEKAFYSEANECTLNNILEWLTVFVGNNAKKGWIEIEKIEGNDSIDQPIGKRHRGYTTSFMEGIRCHMSTVSEWFTTSIIEKIDWTNYIFNTKYSTYKFKFIEDEG